MTDDVRVKARVRLCVEIDVADEWQGSVGLEQVRKQAIESARQRLASFSVSMPGVRVLGIPEVDAVIVTSKG